MSLELTRRQYAEMYGPTVGDHSIQSLRMNLF